VQPAEPNRAAEDLPDGAGGQTDDQDHLAAEIGEGQGGNGEVLRGAVEH
jgi:hypothetical protein